VKKNRILGLAALVAVVGIALAITACTPPDTDERSVTFENHSEAVIKVTCEGSPASFTLQKAKSAADPNPDSVTVTRTGKDIVLTGIVVTDLGPDPWNYLEITGTAVPGDKESKDGVTLKSGILIFKAQTGVPDNPLNFKLDEVAGDE